MDGIKETVQLENGKSSDRISRNTLKSLEELPHSITAILFPEYEDKSTVSEDAPFAKTTKPSDADDGGVDVSKLRNIKLEFDLGKLIGKGGQGEVLEALQINLGRRVALKRILPERDATVSFLKEAFATAQLDHPNIVPIYDLGLLDTETNKKAPALTMKRVVGHSWELLLERDREGDFFQLDLFLQRHLPILIQVINGLSYAHSKNIIHRDLKPAQVMVGDYGEVYLLDWGLAVYLGDYVEPIEPGDINPKAVYTKETAANPAGTPSYMAPEQAVFRGANLGVHTDIYLIGAVLFELVTGKSPHPGVGLMEVLSNAQQNKCHQLPADTPKILKELIERCLATKPENRPESVLEIKAVLMDYLTGASRREESIRIISNLEDKGELKDYQELSEATKKLSQAINLWPDNPDAAPFRDKLLVNFIRVANEEKDFLISKLQAGRLSDLNLAEQMTKETEEAEEKAAEEIPHPPLLTKGRVAMLAVTYLVIVVVLALTNVAARQLLQNEMFSKVSSIATLAANDIRVEDLRLVDQNRDILAPEFQRVLRQISTYRQANDDIRFIYTMRPMPEVGTSTWRILVDADPVDIDHDGDGIISPEEQGNPPGNLYEDGTPEMWAAFGQRITTSGILHDEWGSFISGFAPIIDRNTGEPYAILGVDIKLEDFEERMLAFLIFSVIFGFVLLVLLTATFLAYFSSRKALERVRQLEKEVEKQNQELFGKEIYLG